MMRITGIVRTKYSPICIVNYNDKNFFMIMMLKSVKVNEYSSYRITDINTVYIRYK